MTQYELKFKSVRDIVDLRDFSIQIEKAVRDAIFRKVAVTVYEKYYELDIDPTRGEAKDIGEKNISLLSWIAEVQKGIYIRNWNKHTIVQKEGNKMKKNVSGM